MHLNYHYTWTRNSKNSKRTVYLTLELHFLCLKPCILYFLKKILIDWCQWNIRIALYVQFVVIIVLLVLRTSNENVLHVKVMYVVFYWINCDWACKNWPSECKKTWFFCRYSIITKQLFILTQQNLNHYCRIEWAFLCTLEKRNNTFWTEDISKNITQCNLHSHGRPSHNWFHLFCRHTYFAC